MNMTIRARLTALYFVVLAASFSVFVWISDVGFQRSIEVAVNNASSVNLQSLRQLLALNAPKGAAKVQKELAELASWWPNGVLFESRTKTIVGSTSPGNFSRRVFHFRRYATARSLSSRRI